jgi:hypothetical protein
MRRAPIEDTRDARARKQAVGSFAEHLKERVPKVAALLVATCPDGYPTGGIGGGSEAQSSVESAITDRSLAVRADYSRALEDVGWIAVLARWALDGTPWNLDGTLRHMASLQDMCNRYDRALARDRMRWNELTRQYEDPMRCTGGAGESGFIEWGRPECDNIADPKCRGMCRSCYDRGRYYERKRREEVA